MLQHSKKFTTIPAQVNLELAEECMGEAYLPLWGTLMTFTQVEPPGRLFQRGRGVRYVRARAYIWGSLAVYPMNGDSPLLYRVRDT